MFVICERAVFSHDIIKVAEFLTHGKDIYHTKVHFWITRSSHCGKETTYKCKCCTFHYNM